MVENTPRNNLDTKWDSFTDKTKPSIPSYRQYESEVLIEQLDVHYLVYCSRARELNLFPCGRCRKITLYIKIVNLICRWFFLTGFYPVKIEGLTITRHLARDLEVHVPVRRGVEFKI